MRIPNQAVLFSLLFLPWAHFAVQKPVQYNRPGQQIDIETPKLITAKQSCENWAVAAGLESMLKQQDVDLDQNFWVMKISGGEICSPEVPSAESLASAVNGDFVLDGGRHVHLELTAIPGAPNMPDSPIMQLKQQRLSLMILRGHVYYLTGLTYDEVIYSDGSRMFNITELRLANTFGRNPGLAFVKGRDEMGDIGGVITVSATPAPVHW